jgi:hypothetical protein
MMIERSLMQEITQVKAVELLELSERQVSGW